MKSMTPGARLLAEVAGMSPAYFGMYAASTHEMIKAMGFDFLGFLPPAFLYIGLAAWAAAFTGFAFDLIRRVGASRS